MDSIYTGSDRLEAYLAHHGILGMHWGVRRYQKADGSLTPAGEAHLKKTQKKELKKALKAARKKNEAEYKQMQKSMIVGAKAAREVARTGITLSRGNTAIVRRNGGFTETHLTATDEKTKARWAKEADDAINHLREASKFSDPKVEKKAAKYLKKVEKWKANPKWSKHGAYIDAATVGMAECGMTDFAKYLSHSDLEDDAYLAHHGILGMKWGIRRYRPYPNGYSGSGKEVGEAAKKKPRKLSWKDAKHVAKNIDEYSDEEVSDLVRRLNNRNNILDQLQRDKRRSREGAAYVRSTVKDVISTFKDGVIMYDKIVNGGKKRKD